MAMPLELQRQPVSGLSFPWAFEGNFSAHLSVEDGVGWGEVMWINFEDLETAVVELLGYSYRRPVYILSATTPSYYELSRKLPWQHPYFNQLFVQSITAIEGVRLTGTNESDPIFENFNPTGLGVGDGYPGNLGPWTTFARLKISIRFARPPYYIRTDVDIIDTETGRQQEWLRYVDKNWSVNTQILSREGSSFEWSGQPGVGFPGSVGLPVTHQKLTRRWYQIPEQCIFQKAQDDTPNGLIQNLQYTQTQTTNPITGFVLPINSQLVNTVNTPIGGGVVTVATCSLTNGSAVVSGMAGTEELSVGDAVTGPGVQNGSTIKTIDDVAQITMNKVAVATTVVTLTFICDSTQTNGLSATRMFGCYFGTLRFEGYELIPRPLQLPAYLMQIPFFSHNEAISQQQYDIVLHFDLFDPQRPNSYDARGHNLYPFQGNNLWYPGNSQAASSTVYTITGASNANPIVIDCAAHGLTTGNVVNISGIKGNTAANGTWTIIVLNVDQFSLTGSVGNAMYLGNGTFTVGQKVTAFHYADPKDIFTVL